MKTPLANVPCQKCGQETLEQRSRKDDFGRDILFIICAQCGDQPNLYDVSKQQHQNEMEAKNKIGL